MNFLYRFYLLLITLFLVVHVVISQAYQEVCRLNPGFPGGILEGVANNVLIVVGVVAVIVLISIYRVLKRGSSYSRTTVLIVYGAFAGLSNLVDRVAHGGVCDYLLLDLFSQGIRFNLNDLILFVNTIFIVYFLLFRYANRDKG